MNKEKIIFRRQGAKIINDLSISSNKQLIIKLKSRLREKQKQHKNSIKYLEFNNETNSINISLKLSNFRNYNDLFKHIILAFDNQYELIIISNDNQLIFKSLEDRKSVV